MQGPLILRGRVPRNADGVAEATAQDREAVLQKQHEQATVALADFASAHARNQGIKEFFIVDFGQPA